MPNKGFSIIEVLISIVVMGVIMLSLTYTYIFVRQRNLEDLMRKKADEIMTSVFEDFRSNDFDDMTDNATVKSDNVTLEAENLNSFCDPSDNSVKPHNPLHTGAFIFRSASGNNAGEIPYKVVYKVFEKEDENLELEDTVTVLATICWEYRGHIKYLSRKSVILKEGIL